MAINVSDVERALGFYTGTLGLVARTDRPDFGIAGAWLDAGGQQVHLVEAAPAPSVGQHFALRVGDLEAVTAELREAGFEVSDVLVTEGVSRQAFVKDPDGNDVELHQRLD